MVSIYPCSDKAGPSAHYRNPALVSGCCAPGAGDFLNAHLEHQGVCSSSLILLLLRRRHVNSVVQSQNWPQHRKLQNVGHVAVWCCETRRCWNRFIMSLWCGTWLFSWLVASLAKPKTKFTKAPSCAFFAMRQNFVPNKLLLESASLQVYMGNVTSIANLCSRVADKVSGSTPLLGGSSNFLSRTKENKYFSWSLFPVARVSAQWTQISVISLSRLSGVRAFGQQKYRSKLTQDARRNAQRNASKWDLLSMGVFTLLASNMKEKTFQFACALRDTRPVWIRPNENKQNRQVSPV